MYHQERQLQQLRHRFRQWLPWLKNAIQAEVQILPLGQGNHFKIFASWREKDGTERVHEKVYDTAYLLQLGHVSCAKDYARAFVKEVLGKRGIL